MKRLQARACVYMTSAEIGGKGSLLLLLCPVNDGNQHILVLLGRVPLSLVVRKGTPLVLIATMAIDEDISAERLLVFCSQVSQVRSGHPFMIC